MARRLWQGDFARLWFGARAPRPSPKPRSGGDEAGEGGQTPPAGDRPLGIVERDRRARREKWALRMRD